MRRFSSSLVLPLLSFACLAVLGSAAACSGSVQVEPTVDAAPDTGPGPSRRDTGVEEPDTGAPLRDVTTPSAIDLGTFAGGQELTFTVPANALGFNIVVESLSPNGSISGIDRITSPSGEIVHDHYTPKGGNHGTSYSDWGSIASASVPQSEAKSANPPEPGVWRVRFGGGGPQPTPPPLDGGFEDGGAFEAGPPEGPATMRAKVTVQIGSTAGFVGGRLDLRVYIPKGLKLDNAILDSENAKTNAGVERRVETFFEALTRHTGIERGEVTFHPVATDLAFIDSYELLADGFAASKSRPNEQALNLLLTNGIDFGDGMAAWGIAPGIPGAHTFSGTMMSGIILAVDDTPAVGDGLTILHEAGHFFGLNHTTELTGENSDPLNDTPLCVGISIDDPLSLKACPDKANVMFPTFYGTAGSLIDVSESQKRIYRGSPIYKAYKTPLAGTMAHRTAPTSSDAKTFTLTKSGRALTPTESWLSSGLCGHASHAKLDPNVLVKAHGRDAAIAELTKASTDADLPAMMRRKAAGTLRVLTK